jgi:hypothetical protein
VLCDWRGPWYVLPWGVVSLLTLECQIPSCAKPHARRMSGSNSMYVTGQRLSDLHITAGPAGPYLVQLYVDVLALVKQ